MKKIIALIMIMFMTSGNLYASDNSQIKTVSVTASASQEVEPDRGSIILTIETEAKTAEEAAVLNAQKSNNVTLSVKPYLNDKNGDYIKTGAIGLNPIYNYDKSTNKQVLQGYKAQCSFIIDTAVSNLGKLTDVAVRSGATGTNNFSLYIKDADKYYISLIKEATKKAYLKADAAASVLGVTLKGVKEISVDNSNNYNRYGKMMMSAKTYDSTTGNSYLEVEKGKVELNVIVNGVFIIK